ncbi:hypothetical protein ONZ45_g18479 [Pleurotus djamor]|nr:hypothetical protein ONZ45_g18479 [Pleurotus djamor]
MHLKLKRTSIPSIAFGTWTLGNGQGVIDQVDQAISLGFNHVDTAQSYRNEAEAGRAIRESGLSRNEIFVTTKYSGLNGLDIETSIQNSLENLGLSYVDLYLIHHPRLATPDIATAWAKMEAVKERGLAKSIGVSNFGVAELTILLQSAKIKPVANQILWHPYVYAQQAPILEFAKTQGIATEGYSVLIPITRLPGGPVDKPLGDISKKLGVSADQVLLAWAKAKGVVVVTTSSKEYRLKGYQNAGDIELSDKDILAIDIAGAKGERNAKVKATVQLPVALPYYLPDSWSPVGLLFKLCEFKFCQWFRYELSSMLHQETSTTPRCDFDAFLRAFIFRCIREDLSLQSLQDGIERLERDDNKQESELMRKRKERDELLDKYLEQCLEVVLPIANDQKIRQQLVDYSNSFSSCLKTDRYAPYVDLCNNALSMLKVTEGLPLRSPSSPELQYCSLGPGVFRTWMDHDAFHTTSESAVGQADTALGSIDGEIHDEEAEPEFDSFFGVDIFKVIKDTASKEACAALKESFRRVDVRRNGNEVDVTKQATRNTADSQGLASATIPSPSTATCESTLSKRKYACTSTKSSPKIKRLCLGIENGVEQDEENSDQRIIEGRVQCAAYALEMLSGNPGVLHMINMLHIDDCLFIWYFDREGIVRSDGISFIGDFPRALVLLALFQRFRPEDWGRCATFDCPPGMLSLKVSLSDPSLENKYNPLDIATLVIGHTQEDYVSSQPRCLGGRATRVLKCEAIMKDGSRSDESVVVKISHAEVHRTHEGKTLNGVRNIATKLDSSMKDHLPEPLCYADVGGTDTGRIRSLMGIPGSGCRIMRMVVMKRLEKITSLDGALFLRAWLDALTCHAFLWKHGVEHGDPSLHNIMCHPVTHRGVLTDFDLSILQWEDRVIGCDPIGTVPFMALALLKDEYWNGGIQRCYHHELEAFIWCLPFVCLGGFVADSERHEVITEWVAADPTQCRRLKLDFAATAALEHESHVPVSFAACYELAMLLCRVASNFYTSSTGHPLLRKYRNLPDFYNTRPITVAMSLDLWTRFLAVLKDEDWKKDPILNTFISPFIERLEKLEPSFDDFDEATRSELKDLFYANPDAMESN